MEFIKTLSILCGEKGVSISKAVESIGLSRSSVTTWKNGSKPTPATLQKLADYFGKDVSVFYEQKEPMSVSKIQYSVMMPVIGTVKAGYGLEAQEEFTGEYKMVTDTEGYDPSECRLLRVSGDSMYPDIVEGDTILVHCQPEVESGQVAVIITDEDATLKQVKINSDGIDLIARNPDYKTRHIKGEALQSVRIYGRVLSIVHRRIK